MVENQLKCAAISHKANAIQPIVNAYDSTNFQQCCVEYIKSTTRTDVKNRPKALHFTHIRNTHANASAYWKF